MVDVVASAGAALIYSRHGKVEPRQGAWIAPGSILGAQLGTLLAAWTFEAGLGGAFGSSSSSRGPTYTEPAGTGEPS